MENVWQRIAIDQENADYQLKVLLVESKMQHKRHDPSISWLFPSYGIVYDSTYNFSQVSPQKNKFVIPIELNWIIGYHNIKKIKFISNSFLHHELKP